MTYKIPSSEGGECIFNMSYCLSVHVLTSIASVANALYCCLRFILLLMLCTL